MIFENDEEIDLKPETIKEIVRLLEHLDLFGIEEDLNGRMFEKFLSATMRGESLGQYFTPRSVVKFMTQIAEIKSDKNHIDLVLDGCCGTGGFLIEALKEMSDKIKNNNSLSDKEKQVLIDNLKEEFTTTRGTVVSFLSVAHLKGNIVVRVPNGSLYVNNKRWCANFLYEGNETGEWTFKASGIGFPWKHIVTLFYADVDPYILSETVK